MLCAPAVGKGSCCASTQGRLLPLPLQLEPALRERCFGDHELTSCASYELVWAEDAASSANRWGGIASHQLPAVCSRLLAAGLLLAVRLLLLLRCCPPPATLR